MGNASGPVGLPEKLDGGLLVQVAAREPYAPRELAGDPVPPARRGGTGLVFTGQGALFAARMARRQGYEGAVLVDRRRYAGPSRFRGTARLSPAWLGGQRELGVTAVLSDSGYIGAGDRDALEAVLRQSAEAGVIAVLPLHVRWLREDRATLRDRLAAYGGPIALVLEHAEDPLGSREALAGLTSVVTGPAPAGLLGGDVSALSALAYGGAWAAIGVRHALRRFVPRDARVEVRPGARRVLVDPLLAIVPVEHVAKERAAAMRTAGERAAASEDDLLTCHCRVCGGRGLDWLRQVTGREVTGHNIAVLQRRRNRLMAVPAGARRARYWEKQCGEARRNYDELRARDWQVPAWLEMISQNR